MSLLQSTQSLTMNLPTDFPSYRINPEIISKENEVTERINFLLCESCFWCASYFNNYREVVTKCPICGDDSVESLPISHDEVYSFNYDPKRGVTLGFSKWRSQLA
jgi:hypothetical protein